MIEEVLVFLKEQLNSHLETRSGWQPGDAPVDKVVFLDGADMEPMKFPMNAVSVIMIKLEEEKQLGPPDRFARTSPASQAERVQPEIRLNLHVLFVARFKLYEESLRYLSWIIAYFQGHRVFNPGTDHNLSTGKLVMEMVSLPFSEQNEVWNALRTTYLPSVLYRVKMIVFQDENAQPTVPITEIEIETERQ